MRKSFWLPFCKCCLRRIKMKEILLTSLLQMLFEKDIDHVTHTFSLHVINNLYVLCCLSLIGYYFFEITLKIDWFQSLFNNFTSQIKIIVFVRYKIIYCSFDSNNYIKQCTLSYKQNNSLYTIFVKWYIGWRATQYLHGSTFLRTILNPKNKL